MESRQATRVAALRVPGAARRPGSGVGAGATGTRGGRHRGGWL